MAYRDVENAKSGLSDVKKTMSYVKKYGLVSAARKSLEDNKNNKFNYEEYRRKNEPSKECLEKQKEEGFVFEPLISILLFVKKIDNEFAKETVDSILNQTYPNIELCVLTTKENDKVCSYIKENESRIHKVSYIVSDDIVNYSQGMNRLLDYANGDFITFIDCNDVIAPDAIYENVKMLNKNERVDIVYSDEDYFYKGEDYFSPIFKSSFNIDLLRCCNYIGNMFMVRKSTASKVGGFDESYDCEQKYDFIFRCVEASENSKHISRVLYHNRLYENVDKKYLEYRNSIKKIIIEEHLNRKGIVADVVPTDKSGIFNINYRLLETPKVAIVIDKKGSDGQLKSCINSIHNHTIYRNFEIVITQNHEKVQNVDAEYFLLMDSSMRVTTNNFIEKMLARIVQKDAGVVAGKIIDKNNRVHYAGIKLNRNNVKYLFKGMPMWQEGYCYKAVLQQDVDAAPIYGIMVHKDDYDDMYKGDIINDVDIRFMYGIRKSKRFIMFEPNIIFKK